MILKPSLLLLDEPSSGLSPKLIDILFKKLVSINELETSLLIVEQNAKKSLAVNHRAYVLEMGETRFEGEGKSLLANEEVRKLYLGGWVTLFFFAIVLHCPIYRCCATNSGRTTCTPTISGYAPYSSPLTP